MTLADALTWPDAFAVVGFVLVLCAFFAFCIWMVDRQK